MGKILENMLIAGLSGIIGIIGITRISSLVEKENPKTEMQSDALQLNQDDSRYYVTNKNEEQGINDIKKIINTSDYEEAWMYLPEKQKWYEMGINSSYNDALSQVGHSNRDIENILEKNKDVKELIFYHNHPGDSEAKQGLSLKDIESMVNHTKNFSNYKIKEKICSKFGITEYHLTEKAIKEFKSKDIINLKEYSTQEDKYGILNQDYFTITFKPFKNKK